MGDPRRTSLIDLLFPSPPPRPVYGPPTIANMPPPPRPRGWFDQVGDFLKGAVVGVDLMDPSPKESTAQGLGGMVSALPLAAMMGGLKVIRGGKSAVTAADEVADAASAATRVLSAVPAAPEVPAAANTVYEAAKALYRQRGHGGKGSIVGMAQALKDSGYKFGPMRTAAQKREANAFVQSLVQEADFVAQSQLVPESPFAGGNR